MIKNELCENYSIITIHGTSEVYVENFISIIELCETSIRIRAKNEIISIEGKNIIIEYMNSDDIKICGTVDSIRIVGVLH